MAFPNASDGVVGTNGKRNMKVLSLKNPEIPPHPPSIDIIDIRRDAVEINLKGEILSLLKPESGPKKLPTLLLYNERGLQLFEEITYLEEYYLTNAEIDVLERSADSIAKAIKPGSMVIELGSGSVTVRGHPQSRD